MLIEQIMIGAVVGGILGYFGGMIGGGVEGYISVFARFLDHRGRLVIARIGSDNGKRIGAFSGLLAGVATSTIGDIVSLPTIVAAAGTLFGVVAWWLLQGIDDSIDGFVWGAAGGAMLGAVGGYGGLRFLG